MRAAAAEGRAVLGFLGPRGTYSDQAAEEYRAAVPSIARRKSFRSIRTMVSALARGAVSHAILPAEATVSGVPAETVRLLFRGFDPGFRIVDELTMPIESHLLARPGTGLAEITAVLSHPNALAEAAGFLRQACPEVTLIETRSTAAAAQAVARGEPGLAAVAGPAAARLYGLATLAAAIQDDKENATSFWVIAAPDRRIAAAGREPGQSVPPTWPPAAADRLVLALEAPPGSRILTGAVTALADRGFAVVGVQSRPLPGPLFGYRFAVGFAAEAPVAMRTIARAIAHARHGAGRLIPIGAYRRRPRPA